MWLEKNMRKRDCKLKLRKMCLRRALPAVRNSAATHALHVYPLSSRQLPVAQQASISLPETEDLHKYPYGRLVPAP